MSRETADFRLHLTLPMAFSLFSNTTAPDDRTALDAVVARLRAEHDATESEARRGVLLHEVATLEALLEDESQAARDFLAAVNSKPDLREPLEQLLLLMERRKSSKNQVKLVERISKVSETKEESARALLSMAELQEDVDSDLDGAREALLQAVDAKPDDIDSWLALEHLAARTGDEALRLRALTARSELAELPTWKALLLVDVARARLTAGDADGALSALETALETRSGAEYAVLAELAHLGVAAGRQELLLRAAVGQAELAELAMTDSTDPRALGVPAGRGDATHAAHFFLRAAGLARKAGGDEDGGRFLERAAAHAPTDPAVTALCLGTAVRNGDAARAAELAKGELARGVRGPLAAALQMRVTEAAAAAGDATTAIAALKAGLAEDPGSIPAWALLLHLLGGSDPALLAEALEKAATDLDSPDLGAKLLLLAADTHARARRNTVAARAALAQATTGIGTAEVRARLGRGLAAALGDAEWFEAATRELLATDITSGERAGLWFDLARASRLRGDHERATEALLELGTSSEGAWLGNALLAFAPDPGRPDAKEQKPDQGPAALERMASGVTDPAEKRAFSIAAAARHARREGVEDAERLFGSLANSDAGDLIASLSLSHLATTKGDAEAAERALAAAAMKSTDEAVSASLLLEAGIAKWTRGDREGAIRLFEDASERNRGAASALLTWGLRAASPNDLEARRRALEAAREAESPALLALERFGLEAASGGPPVALSEGLAGVSGDGVVDAAIRLARAVSPGATPDERMESEAWLAERGAGAGAIGKATTHFSSAPGSSDARALLSTAIAWSEADPGLPAALEVFVRAVSAADLPAEIAARETLGSRLGEADGARILASARILAHLAKRDAEAKPLSGKEPAVLLANLELSPPGSDPHLRARSLSAGAQLFEPASSAVALSLVGWNLLATGEARGAIQAFRSYLEHHPEDIVGWEGLRAAAEVCGDKGLLAEASAALGDLSSDAGQGAELWERAALILLDDLKDEARGEASLSRAVERDITRPVAFDRLFRLVRAKKDGPRLLELITRRLTVAEDPEELAKLYWERARVLRGAGNGAAALEALENVAMLEPDHVGALALTGEIYITEKRFEEAAETLARLSRLGDAPAEQRLMSGLAAADLYESRLGDLGKGLAVLVDAYRAGLATLAVRERIARSAVKAEAWEVAAELYEALMTERETQEGRIDAARSALVTRRDRLGAPKTAASAAARLLSESPDDGEALDLVLAGHASEPQRTPLLQRGKAATQRALMENPMDLQRMVRLSEIAEALSDSQLRQVSLGGIIALGGLRKDRVEELASLDARIARTPQIAIDETVIAGLRDPEDRGPLSELLSAIATTLAEALGPGIAALGVTKKERIRPQDGLPVRNEIAAWTGALGLGEFELYVGGRDATGICGIATEVPAIVVGAEVKAPLSAPHRQALARELLALKLGITILRHRDPTDIGALVVAACNLAEVKMESPPFAMLAEFERRLGKEMPRRVRKALPEVATRVAREKPDMVSWVRAANSTLDRLAAIAVGDVSWVLAGGIGIERGGRLASAEENLRAGRLLSFVVSPTFFAVREKLGMGVR